MSAVQQQESTLIVGTITSVAGNAKVTVTKAGMTGSPLDITVLVAQNDTGTLVAGKMATAMNLIANFSAVCLAYSVGATLYVLVKTAAANDDTMNVAYDNDTCTGLTADATSVHAAYGDAGTITNGYCTLANIKDSISELGLATNATDDGWINDAIEDVSRYIDEETGKRFYTTSADETRYYTAENASSVQVFDLISITTLKTDDGTRTYATTWATTDYDLFPYNQAPYNWIAKTPQGTKSFNTVAMGVQVVGKFGFSSTTPRNIRRACMGIVVSLYQSRRGVGTEGIAQVTGAGVVITPHDVPQFAAKIIEGYVDNL